MPHRCNLTVLGRKIVSWLCARPDGVRSALAVHFSKDGAWLLRQADDLLIQVDVWAAGPRASKASACGLLGQLQHSAEELLREVPRQEERARFWGEWEDFSKRHGLIAPQRAGDVLSRSEDSTLDDVRAYQRTLRRLMEVLVENRVGFWPRGAFRALVTLCVVVGAVTLLVGAATLVRRPPNLLRAAGLTTSSKYLFWPTHDMLFHTDQDPAPWALYDLGKVQTVSRVDVKNTRSFPERAIPLSVEVSRDGTQFREVAVRTEPFQLWKASIEPTEARYVRLKVKRRTYLHLADVRVRP